jgi:hypothetical protein
VIAIVGLLPEFPHILIPNDNRRSPFRPSATSAETHRAPAGRFR